MYPFLIVGVFFSFRKIRRWILLAHRKLSASYKALKRQKHYCKYSFTCLCKDVLCSDFKSYSKSIYFCAFLYLAFFYMHTCIYLCMLNCLGFCFQFCIHWWYTLAAHPCIHTYGANVHYCVLLFRINSDKQNQDSYLFYKRMLFLQSVFFISVSLYFNSMLSANVGDKSDYTSDEVANLPRIYCTYWLLVCALFSDSKR